MQGACLMYRPQDIEKVLRKFPIEDVWGIGRKHRRMLQAANVRTAWDFVQASRGMDTRPHGGHGAAHMERASGRGVHRLRERPRRPNSRSPSSRSFAHELTQYEEIHTSVAAFASMAAEKLRRQQSLCGEVTVYILTNRHPRGAAPVFRKPDRAPRGADRQHAGAGAAGGKRPCNAYSAKATATRKPGLRFRTFRRARGCKPTCSTPWIVPGTPG